MQPQIVLGAAHEGAPMGPTDWWRTHWSESGWAQVRTLLYKHRTHATHFVLSPILEYFCSCSHVIWTLLLMMLSTVYYNLYTNTIHMCYCTWAHAATSYPSPPTDMSAMHPPPCPQRGCNMSNCALPLTPNASISSRASRGLSCAASKADLRAQQGCVRGGSSMWLRAHYKHI